MQLASMVVPGSSLMANWSARVAKLVILGTVAVAILCALLVATGGADRTGAAPPAPIGSSECTPDNASSFAWSHTVGSGSDRLLLVGIALDQSSAQAVTSVSYGLTPMSETAVVTNAGNVKVVVYSLVDPPVGTANVDVALSAAANASCGASSWSGVDQTNSLSTPASATGLATIGDDVASLDIASDPGQVVVDVIGAVGSAALSPASAQSTLWAVDEHQRIGGEQLRGGSHIGHDVVARPSGWHGVGDDRSGYQPSIASDRHTDEYTVAD